MLTLPISLLILSLPSVLASPHLLKRDSQAGAPTRRPIPSNCSILSPLSTPHPPSYPPPSADPDLSTQPKPTLGQSLIYAYYLPIPLLESQHNVSTLLMDCMETCHGYGVAGTCKSAFLAYNVPTPEIHGAPGGNPSVACLNYGSALEEGDFETSEGTTYLGAAAGTIKC